MRKFWAITGIAVAALAGTIQISGVSYIYKALWYNFAGIDDYTIFDNRTVKATNPIALPNSSELNKTAPPDSLMQKLEMLESIAFLVVKNDTVVYEKYWEGYGPNSHSNSFSMAKSIVSALTGIAIAEGKIKSLDEPVGNYLGSFKEGERGKITFRHLLTMSSGLDWVENYMLPVSDITEAYYGSDLQKTIENVDVELGPGTQFRYKSGDTQILSMALSKAVGMSLSDYASLKLWGPVGAKNDALWSTDQENGIEKAYCCFNSNARDFAKFGLLYLHHGRLNGQQIIPEAYVRESLQPIRIPNQAGIKTDYYAYSWWLINYKNQWFPYARGILGQYIILFPQKNMVAVRLGHQRGERRKNAFEEVYDIIDFVLDSY